MHLPTAALWLQMTLYQTLPFAMSVSPRKLRALNLLLKTFTKLVDSRKIRFAPNTPASL